MPTHDIQPEHHPLGPFLPQGAKILMLGSFPPKHDRWSMEFFYPNFQNDMWRIFGLLFFNNTQHFVITGERRFNYELIVEFCTNRGIAIYDTATTVKRLKDNASDKYLEIVQPTDIAALLTQIHQCQTIMTTGQKATDTICDTLGCIAPKTGGHTQIVVDNRSVAFYRMPSSSRAYPLPLEQKAELYRLMFSGLQMI